MHEIILECEFKQIRIYTLKFMSSCKTVPHIEILLCRNCVINNASPHLPVSAGGHLLRPVGAVQPLHRLLGGGAAGGAQLGFPPPQAAAAHGQHGQRHDVPRQQHHQPGHVRGVQDQHAGLDDPLAGAQQGQGAAAGLHAGQRGHGHHDRHEHRPLLPAAPE